MPHGQERWPPQQDLPLPDLLRYVGVPNMIVTLVIAGMNKGIHGMLVTICSLFRFQSSWRFLPIADPAEITTAAARTCPMLWAWRAVYSMSLLLWDRPATIGAPCLLCATWTGSWCDNCDDVTASLCTECEDQDGVCPRCDESTSRAVVEFKPATIRLRANLYRLLALRNIEPEHWIP